MSRKERKKRMGNEAKGKGGEREKKRKGKEEKGTSLKQVLRSFETMIWRFPAILQDASFSVSIFSSISRH